MKGMKKAALVWAHGLSGEGKKCWCNYSTGGEKMNPTNTEIISAVIILITVAYLAFKLVCTAIAEDHDTFIERSSNDHFSD